MFVALMVIRNEASILPITLGHLLYTVNVDRVIVADNGSSDGTRSVLACAVKIDHRVCWTDASGPFDQQSIVTGLAQDAYRLGASWLLPTDADEFHWLKVPLRTLDVRGVGAWELQVTNFVQLERVRHESDRSLRTMCFSAVPLGSIEEARKIVTAGKIAFVQSRYPQKLALRAAKDLIIFKGNHSADRLAGEVRKASAIEILHAPMRAGDAVYKRIESAKRLNAANPEESWHLKRLLEFNRGDQIEGEWHKNSIKWGRLGPKAARVFARPDFRIVRIAFRQAAFAKAVRSSSFDLALESPCEMTLEG
jgi:glycosyltransferase involved in cell wall biosynthesis